MEYARSLPKLEAAKRLPLPIPERDAAPTVISFANLRMTGIDEALARGRAASQAGNPVHGVKQVLTACAQLAPHEQVSVALQMVDLVRSCPRTLLPRERDTIAQSLRVGADALAEPTTPLLDAAATEIMELPVSSLEPCVGTVWMLTVVDAAPRFGAIHSLNVEGEIGCVHRFDALDVSSESSQAFERGILAARDYLYRHKAGGLDSSIALRSFGFAGTARSVQGMTGSSLGLASSLAVLSTLLDQPLPGNLAVTGGISLDRLRTIDDVGGVPQKIVAARAAGLRVMIPGSGDAVEGIVPVSTLDEAVDAAFAPGAVERGLMRLHNLRLPQAARERRFADYEGEIPPDGFLISAVGDTDPTPSAYEEGNILSIASRFHPKFALLLHSADKDMRGRALDTQTALLKRGCTSVLVSLPTTDPTNYDELFRDFRAAVLKWLEDTPEAARGPVLTNVSSGTPQMKLTLHLLVERGILPDVQIQVRKAGFVAAGDHRARRIRLPLL